MEVYQKEIPNNSMNEESHQLSRSTKILQFIQRLFNSVFIYELEGNYCWIAILWIAGLFILGCLLWWYFLNGGAIQLNLHDWVEASKRAAIIKDAITTGQFPFHMPGTSAGRGVTDRFLSIVDTNISPQVLLLGFLDIGMYYIANVILLYTLGFLGLLLLRRQLKLSLIALTILFFLVFFNGHVIDHIAVGHLHWAAYLLIPFFVFSVLKLIREEVSWIWILFTSFTLFFITLQGAYHLFFLCLMFLGLLLFPYLSKWKSILKAWLFAVLLSMVRILPPILELSDFDTEFLSGFTTATELITALILLKLPVRDVVFSNNPLNPLGWWEKDYFISSVGLGFVLYFGIYSYLTPEGRKSRLVGFLFPILTMTILSIGQIYEIFHKLHLPVLSTQRVSTRLFYLPLVFTITIGAITLQRKISTSWDSSWLRIAIIGASVVMINDLWQHLKLWRVVNMGKIFPPTPLDLNRFYVANHDDPLYYSLIALGGVISFISLVSLIILAIRDRDREKDPQPPYINVGV